MTDEEVKRDFLDALKQSTRDIRESVAAQLNEQDKERKASIDRLNTNLEVTQSRIGDITETLRPMPGQIASIQTSIKEMQKVNESQWEHITTSKDQLRDFEVRSKDQIRELEVKIARATSANCAKPRQSSVMSSVAPPVDFWATNGKWVFALIALLIIGLFSIAGVNLSIKDIAP
jgi:chromosome segregation ATPase